MRAYARFIAKGCGRRIVAVAVAMAMLTLMAAAVACDPEDSQPTDAPPTVREILDAFTVAQATVETGSLTIKMAVSQEITAPGGGGATTAETSVTISGDYQAPDRSRVKTVVTNSGYSYRNYYIIIGDDVYHGDPFSGEWEVGQDVSAALGETGHVGELDLALEDEVVQFITLVGVEELGGVEVYHLEGSLPASDAIFPTTDLSLSQK